MAGGAADRGGGLRAASDRRMKATVVWARTEEENIIITVICPRPLKPTQRPHRHTHVFPARSIPDIVQADCGTLAKKKNPMIAYRIDPEDWIIRTTLADA